MHWVLTAEILRAALVPYCGWSKNGKLVWGFTCSLRIFSSRKMLGEILITVYQMIPQICWLFCKRQIGASIAAFLTFYCFSCQLSLYAIVLRHFNKPRDICDLCGWINSLGCRDKARENSLVQRSFIFTTLFLKNLEPEQTVPFPDWLCVCGSRVLE